MKWSVIIFSAALYEFNAVFNGSQPFFLSIQTVKIWTTSLDKFKHLKLFGLNNIKKIYKV